MLRGANPNPNPTPTPIPNQVEYLPCSLVTGGAALLRDFLQRLLPPDARDVRRPVETKQGPFLAGWPLLRLASWPRRAEARGWPTLGAAPGIRWRWPSLLGAILADPRR